MIFIIFNVKFHHFPYKAYPILDWQFEDNYPMPIKIYAPLNFAHLVYAKIKGSKFAQYKCAKIEGRKNIMND